MKPKVFLTRELPPTVLAFLREHCDLAMNSADRVLTAAEVIAGLRGRDALLCNITDPITAEIMDAAPVCA